MRYYKVWLFLLILLNTIVSGQVDSSLKVAVTTIENKHVSICQLLTNPSKYHGEGITVSGYLHLKMENNALYLSKEQADYILNEYAVWIDFADSLKVEYLIKGQYEESNNEDLKLLDCKYVRIEGVFNRNNHGHFGSYAGSIEKIRHISELRRWYDGSKEWLGMDKASGKIVPIKNKK